MHEEALACELASHYYFELGDAVKAMQHFTLAHKKYQEWGAFGKCDDICEFISSNITPLEPASK